METPTQLSDSLRNLEAANLSEVGKTYHQRVVNAGFDIYYDLNEDAARQIINLALEPAIKEFCPNDSGKRFKDLDALQEWLIKGRIVVLLTKKENNSTKVVGYGWVGAASSPYIKKGEATFAIRIGEGGQGQGLGTPFAELIVEVAANIFDVSNIWLETWQSNAGAVHIYHKIGFVDVASEPGKRKSADGSEVDDVRLFMSLPNSALPLKT